jgi:predicted phosphodiesterase
VYSILHISDLHRSPRDNITNAELISALVSDRQRYLNETTSIRKPDAIVISGDIVQGVSLETVDADARLAEQYSTALAFIVELTERFVDGDRSRVIIVPGNHDINWVMSKDAMGLVQAADFPKDLRGELLRSDSLYRWDWKTQDLYLITKVAAYGQRMDAFWNFFETYYSSASGLLRVGRDQPSNLYSLWDGRIGIAAFDSCHRNDCFAFHGSIPKDVVARAQLDLLDSGGFGLLMAVWHHNIEGPPHRTDYMDIDIVRGMIGRGFRVGLYGHQHRPDATPMQIRLAERETMALVSAGSLCAGANEIPTGAMRGYNIVEIHDDLQSARVHFREMSVANLFSAARRGALGGASFVDLKWDPPADLAGRTVDASMQRRAAMLAEGERYLKAGNPGACKKLLEPMASELPPFGRLLLLEAARRTNDQILLIKLLSPPLTIGELIERTETCILAKDYANAAEGLDRHGVDLGIIESHSREMRAKIFAGKAMTL